MISFYFFPSFFLLFWWEGSFTPSLKSGFPHTLPQPGLLTPSFSQSSSHPPSIRAPSHAPSAKTPHTHLPQSERLTPGSHTPSLTQGSLTPTSLSQSASLRAPSHPPSPRTPSHAPSARTPHTHLPQSERLTPGSLTPSLTQGSSVFLHLYIYICG